MSDFEPISGPLPPYGPPIREAVASGDTVQMQVQADNARSWLAANPGNANAEDVRAALSELDVALKQL